MNVAASPETASEQGRELVEPAPRVTLGVPVYNGARFLAESLDSLLAQTYEDFELIISDNGSTDGTEAICRGFAERDTRVRYHRSEANRGASWNFNNVFHLSSGRYFKWATHDDVLAKTYLERCVAVLDQAPAEVVLCYPKTKIIDENGAVVRAYEDGLDLRQRAPHARLRHLVKNIIMSNPAFGLIRSDALRQTRLLEPFVSSDYVLLAELAMLGQFWEVPDHLFFRREHAGMSRYANVTPSEVAEWFEPGSGRGNVTEFSRLFVEHLRSIERSPLARSDKLQAYLTFVPVWMRRHGPQIAEEAVRIARGRIAAR